MRGALKPEYIFRPRQGLRRALQAIGLRPTGPTEVRLPWGLSIQVDPEETIGRSIVQAGIYDLPVTEIIWRLSKPGMTAVDVGANIGYMTSLLAARSGPRGHVVSIEPHPWISEALSRNCESWAGAGNSAPVEIRRCAVGAVLGTGKLGWDSTFAENQGTARLKRGMPNEVEVEVRTLDQLAPSSAIEILKIDVEGCELEAIAGARDLLSSKRVRYVVVESEPGKEKNLVEALARVGYRPYAIERSLLRPVLTHPLRERSKHAFEPLSLLALRSDEEVPVELNPTGWKCLTAKD